jgi:hypothetical protein
VTLGAGIAALAVALGEGLRGLREEIEELGGQPVDGPLTYSAYATGLTLVGNSLSAGPGAYPAKDFALLSKSLPGGLPGALEISLTRGCQISFKPTKSIGDEPIPGNRLLIGANSLAYISCDRGDWLNTPYEWLPGDRLSCERAGTLLAIKLKRLEGTVADLHSFTYPLTQPVFFHLTFYVEPPSEGATFSNPWGYQLATL